MQGEHLQSEREMTIATFHKPDANNCLTWIKVNGRKVYVSRIEEFKQTRPGHFEGVANETPFHIEGGRAAGGTSRDWFLDWGRLLPNMRCTSLVNAINMIESC